METITASAPIKLTEGALKELNRLIQDPGFDKQLKLRIGVKGGGCSGLSYILGFDQKESDDNEYSAYGLDIIMKPAHELYLAGMEIDFAQGLNARGFTFNNPNASSSCGCGTSFAV